MSGRLGTTGELAGRLKAELSGPSDVELCALDTLGAGVEGTLTFVRAARHASSWASSGASAVLVSRAVRDARPEAFADGRPVLVVDDADLALIELLEALRPKIEHVPGIDPSAHVDPTATVDGAAWIGPCARVGAGATVGAGARVSGGASVGRGVRVGEGSEILENAVLYDHTEIGRGVTIHAGAVIGADGFGYRPSPDGKGVLKVPHVGRVVIEDGVEIGACTTIDRGKFGATRIGAGTKIDNQVQIGHNCVIGRSCIICGCTGIAGSVTVGDGVTIAGGVGIADNVTIGDGATLGAQSGIAGNVPAGATMFGSPAREGKRQMRNMVVLDQLAASYDKIKPLLRGDS